MPSFSQPLIVLMTPQIDTSVNKELKSQGITHKSQRFFFFNTSCMYFRLQFTVSIQQQN